MERVLVGKRQEARVGLNGRAQSRGEHSPDAEKTNKQKVCQHDNARNLILSSSDYRKDLSFIKTYRARYLL